MAAAIYPKYRFPYMSTAQTTSGGSDHCYPNSKVINCELTWAVARNMAAMM